MASYLPRYLKKTNNFRSVSDNAEALLSMSLTPEETISAVYF
jgi:hypothetical protein